jgi:hypothetical protein
MRIGGGEPEDLSNGQHHWPSIIEGRDAVLVMSHTSVMELSVIDLGTGETKSLGLEGTSPRYLPSGHVVYALTDGSVWGVTFDAASLETVGSPVRLLTDVDVKGRTEGAANFAVSENGHAVYATGTHAPQLLTSLVAVGRDGSKQVLTQLEGIGWYPRVSPDGSRIAFGLGADPNISAPADLWTLDASRGARTRVTFGGNNRFTPLWTPDGTRLTHADGNVVPNRILTTAADGSGIADTLLADELRRFPTSWSADGRTLAFFAVDSGLGHDIGLLDTAGSGVPRPFISTPFFEAGALFSPDGEWVAYVSDKSGQKDVYARPFPGPGAEIPISVGGGVEPAWAPTGRVIYYRHQDDLMEVSFTGAGSGLVVGSPRRLFTDTYRREDRGPTGAVANYDVTRDGVGFIMVEDAPPVIAEAPDASVRIRVVVNFLDELRQRVPN